MFNLNDMMIYDDPRDLEVFPQGKLFRLSYDSSNNKMRIRCLNRKDLDELIDVFSDTNPASFFMKQYGYNVPSKISVINNFGYFASGLFFDIVRYIKLQYGSLSVVEMSENIKRYIQDFMFPLKKKITELGRFEISNISDDSGLNYNRENKMKLRDYQLHALEQLFFSGYGNGIVDEPTSSGKSFLLCNYIHNIQKYINKDYIFLLLVPNKQLVFQMYNDFKDYGYDMSIVTKLTGGLKKGDRYNPEAKVIISNRQQIFTNMDVLPDIDVLICDEVHSCCAEKTQSIIEQINAKIRIGCSGSIPKNKYNKWIITGMFGQIVAKEKITDLQKRGYITKMKLYQLNVIDNVVENDRNYLFHLRPLRKYNPDETGYSEIPFNAAHDAEHEYYAKYYKELYTPILKYIAEFGDNTLLLFDKIEFGTRLFELSKELFPDKKVHYIDGSVDVNRRLEIVSEIEKGDGNMLFAENATFSTGVNVKRLSNLCFISSSKSFPRILQSIGRTLRLHSSKEEARIFDVNFNFKYSRRHLAERLKIYKEEYNKIPDIIETIVI